MNNQVDLRAYFAANAPASIPDWFVRSPDLPRLPEILHWYAALDSLSDYRALGDDDQCKLRMAQHTPPSVGLTKLWEQAKEVERESAQTYQAALYRRHREVYFAWRWYYADQMIAQGKEPR